MTFENKRPIIDLFVFSIIIFVSVAPNFSYFKESYLWISFVGLWGLIGQGDFKKIVFTNIDSILGGIVSYLFVRFFFNESEFYLYKSDRFLELLGYIVFYIKTKNLVSELQKIYKLYWILYPFLGLCFSEAILATLQYIDIANSTNEFFKLTGTLHSPNYLGLLLGLGVICVIWLCVYVKQLKRNQKIILSFLGVFLILIIGVSNSRTAWIVVLIGAVLLGFNTKKVSRFIKGLPNISKIIYSALLSILMLSGAYFLYNFKKDSADGRFLINKITSLEICKQPLLGHGLFSFEKGYNTAKSIYFTESKRPWEEVRLGNYVYNAFNDYLYFGYELGLLIPISILFGLVFLIYKCKKTPNTLLGISLLIALCVAAFFMSVSTKSIFILTGLFALNVCYKKSKGNYQLKGLYNLVPRIMFILLSITTLILVTKSFLYVKEVKAFGDLKDSEKKEKTKEELANLFGEHYDRGYVKYNQGYYVLNSGNLKQGLVLMEQGYNENKAPKLGKSLANTHLSYSHNYKRAEALFGFNTTNEAFRYEPRMNLLYLYERVFDTKKMDSLAKEIIAFPVKKPSKKVDQYKKYCNDLLKRLPYQKHDLNIEGNISGNYIVKSKVLKRTLKHRIYLPNIKYITKSLPVVYLADGQQYVKDSLFIKTIDQLIQKNKIAPVALVFMDSSDYFNPRVDHRQDYYLCNNDYVDFVTKELIPEIEKYYPVSNNKQGRSVMGYSFGGLFAGYAGIKAPEYFKNIIMQSPAYHPCPKVYTLYNKMPKQDFNMYLSYGTGKDTESQDVPMIAILQAKGYSLNVNRVKGADHKWSLWMSQIEEIFLYFFKK